MGNDSNRCSNIIFSLDQSLSHEMRRECCVLNTNIFDVPFTISDFLYTYKYYVNCFQWFPIQNNCEWEIWTVINKVTKRETMVICWLVRLKEEIVQIAEKEEQVARVCNSVYWVYWRFQFDCQVFGEMVFHPRRTTNFAALKILFHVWCWLHTGKEKTHHSHRNNIARKNRSVGRKARTRRSSKKQKQLKEKNGFLGEKWKHRVVKLCSRESI